MSPRSLLLISLRVAGLVRVSKTVTVEVPYAKGVNMWDLEQKGKLPSATKEAILDIVRGHGGKHPKYEEDGLFFDVPADKAESAAEDIEHLHGIDKSFKKLFDVRELLKRTTPKERPAPEKKPSRAEKKADKLLEKADRLDPAEEKALKKEMKSERPSKKAPEPDESKLQDLNKVLQRPKKTPAKPAPKADPAKPAAPGKGKRRVFNPKKQPDPIPADHEQVLESVNNLRRTLKSDDEDAFMDAVRSFLDTVNYESWA